MIRKIDDHVSVAPQISVEEVAAIAQAGFAEIVNNRPDDEEPGQVSGAAILDVAIVLAREIDPMLYARRLDRNRVYAIGQRSLLDGADPVTDPEQMRGLTALLHRDMPDTFTQWRRAAGYPDLEPLAVDHFDSGSLMLEAAAQGLGVAFMLESHFAAAKDDRLVQLFDVVTESDYSYWFVCRPRALQTRPVRIFHDWIVETVAEG